MTLKELMEMRKTAGLGSVIRRGLSRVERILPKTGKLSMDVHMAPTRVGDKLRYMPSFKTSISLGGRQSLLERLEQQPWAIPAIMAGAGSAILASTELGSYIAAKAQKDKNFKIIVSKDEYLKENKNDAKELYDRLYRIAPRAMSNPHLARQVLRQAVSMGTLSPELVRQLQGIESMEHPAHKMLGHVSNFKMPGGLS